LSGPAPTSASAPPKRSGPGGSNGRDSQRPSCGCGQAISTVPAASGTTCESLEPSDSRRRVRFVPYAETIQ